VSDKPSSHETSPWPHRFAVLLVCATFPLIWVGGLVTTYDAGMAFDDWPTTRGYNLFLYPWQTWLAAPWDMFIEHGHRLLGALVGLVTIGFVWSVWQCDPRRWLRGAACAALALVVLQGGLGGLRVLLDERQLAMIHGCVGPAFFAYAVALAVMTSKWWQTAAPLAATVELPIKLRRLSLLTLLFVYVQLLIGAQVRHVPVTASPDVFRFAVLFHLLMALVVTVHIVLLLAAVLKSHRKQPAFLWPALALAALIVVQLGLGASTWVVKYGWPEMLAGYSFAAGYTVQAKSLLPSLIVTGHVATGSLILALAVVMHVRAARAFRLETTAISSGALIVGLAT
jgi:cytochrome c oxidase assembly protein subunit 15